MAHDVYLEGALFPDVPAVMLPDGNATFHRFTDVTDTTATAADVTAGTYFYNAAGVRTAGTATVPEPSSTTPAMDGTAAVGTATTYARADHVHPTDTSRQATLVSGTNIKTINGTSLLGSGNISTAELPTVTTSDNGKVLMVVSGTWAAASLPSASGVSF